MRGGLEGGAARRLERRARVVCRGRRWGVPLSPSPLLLLLTRSPYRSETVSSSHSCIPLVERRASPLEKCVPPVQHIHDDSTSAPEFPANHRISDIKNAPISRINAHSYNIHKTIQLLSSTWLLGKQFKPHKKKKEGPSLSVTQKPSFTTEPTPANTA